jgi:hypothetical protein
VVVLGWGVGRSSVGAATAPASRRSSWTLGSGTTSKSSRQTMHWSAMLTDEFAKLIVDDGGGSHERGLGEWGNCLAGRWWWLFEVADLKVEVLVVDE